MKERVEANKARALVDPAFRRSQKIRGCFGCFVLSAFAFIALLSLTLIPDASPPTADGPRADDAADGPWVPHVRALTTSNSERVGYGDGFQAATRFVVQFSYSSVSTSDLRDQLANAKGVAISAYDQLADKHDLNQRVYRSYRQGWMTGFEACASTASVNRN